MKKMMKIVTVFCFTTLILVGCSGKINKDNYNKISNGMSISEVESILGKGESLGASSYDLGEYGGDQTLEVITWSSGMKVISLTFENEKLSLKTEFGL